MVLESCFIPGECSRIQKHGSEQGIEAARRARNLHLQSLRQTKAARITQRFEEATLFREKHSLRPVSSTKSPV
jgi:hypothetical protein